MLYEEWKRLHPDGSAPGGETEEQLHARTLELLDELLERYSGTRVLTISHGALIRKVVNILSLEKYPLPGERIANASMSVIVHDQAGWRLEHYGPLALSGS
jgi:broad specificity phosphatase PhoE